MGGAGRARHGQRALVEYAAPPGRRHAGASRPGVQAEASLSFAGLFTALGRRFADVASLRDAGYRSRRNPRPRRPSPVATPRRAHDRAACSLAVLELPAVRRDRALPTLPGYGPRGLRSGS